ncbi:hypothetical protein PL321_05350 [Caloramator sp. mosi_1]|uniref:hypothetical protein n=1 Tax=Caloramator sp. mosi_1 TaxID=3023090 RepID=UPI002361A1AF|nr:hypothetical protein [Caloramator sp. mosi_1]WDC84975.1 hypothetical protein PL321_05350 [Caloramator sp. mosi_1]
MSAIRYSRMIDPNDIEIYNEEGIKADSVVVRNLQPGEEVLIYDAEDKLLGKVKADKKELQHYLRLSWKKHQER